jgi:predicted ATPase
VFIVPDDEKSTSDRFRTRVTVHVGLPGDLSYFQFPALLGFLASESGDVSDARKIEDELGQIDDPTGLLEADDSHRLFTMLPSIAEYRRLVRVIGPELTSDVLLAINDIVALVEFRPDSDIPQLVTSTPLFQRSFVRSSEAFFAYKNAGPVLRGIGAEEFGRMPSEIQLNFQLAGRPNHHRLQFRFDHKGDLPKRIAVVIGKNGVGKSQSLGQIVRAALSGDEVSLREGTTLGRVSVNRLLAFAPTGEWTSVFPAERRKNPKIWYKRFALNRARRPRKGNGIADMVLQLARLDEDSYGFVGVRSRWEIFLGAIRAIANWEQIVLENRNKDEGPIPIVALRPGAEQTSYLVSRGEAEEAAFRTFWSIDPTREPVRLVGDTTYPLSSGEISFVRFAVLASLYVDNGSLLLLDEPETHLHPNFISRFVALLNSLLSATGSAAIIATHSAYFVREVFREQVTVLRSDDTNHVSTESIRLQTFGADVGAISYFVFGEDEPSEVAADVERRLLAAYDSWPALFQRYKDELSHEMLGALRLAIDARGEDE